MPRLCDQGKEICPESLSDQIRGMVALIEDVRGEIFNCVTDEGSSLLLPGTSPAQRATQLRQLSFSYRQVAAALGTSESTARRLIKGSNTDQPERVVGRDGRSRCATRPTS